MKKNVSKIKGNNNVIQQDKENNLQTGNKSANDDHKRFYEKANFWLGVAALVVAIIVGWDAIMKIIEKI